MGDESWMHHYATEANVTSMEWKHFNFTSRKKLKVTPSAGTVMLTMLGIQWSYSC